MQEITKKYNFAVIATDTVVFRICEERLKVLLIKMNKKPFKGTWALPGGLVESKESVGESSKRVLK